MGSGSPLQIVAATLLALGFVKILTVCQPYRSHDVYVTAEIALWQLFIIFYLIIVTKFTSLGEGIPLFVIDLFMVFLFFGNMGRDIYILGNLTYSWLLARTQGRKLDPSLVSSKVAFIPYHRNSGVRPVEHAKREASCSLSVGRRKLEVVSPGFSNTGNFEA